MLVVANLNRIMIRRRHTDVLRGDAVVPKNNGQHGNTVSHSFLEYKLRIEIQHQSITFMIGRVGFYIYAAVEMVGARLSEVSCQREFVMYRGLITNNCE